MATPRDWWSADAANVPSESDKRSPCGPNPPQYSLLLLSGRAVHTTPEKLVPVVSGLTLSRRIGDPTHKVLGCALLPLGDLVQHIEHLV